jgi:murein DD-endopeptidase MepM/ murein hydrolase activator NlpD
MRFRAGVACCLLLYVMVLFLPSIVASQAPPPPPPLPSPPGTEPPDPEPPPPPSLPPETEPDPETTLILNSVGTFNGEAAPEQAEPQTSFAPGEAIRYAARIKNTGSSTVTVSLDYLVTGPKEIYSLIDDIDIPPDPPEGGWNLYVTTTIPTDAPSGTYTLRVTMTINGQSSTKESSFTVLGGSGLPPAAPSNVQAVGIMQASGLSTQVSWTDNADNELGYVVVDQSRPQEYEAESTPGVGVTGTLILPFVSSFCVYAYNEYGNSPLSDDVCTGEVVASQCSNATFIIPHDGPMGWPYMDPGQDVIEKDGTIHRGIDIFGDDHEPVYAPYDGVVVAEGDVFRIRHSGLGVDTYYGHVTNTLPIGAQVKRGHKVAELLPLGSNTHLHFTITHSPPKDTNELIFQNSIDPSSFLNAQLNYFDGTRRIYDNTGIYYIRPVIDWCNTTPVGIIQGIVKAADGKGVSDARVEIEETQQSRRTDFWMGPNDNGSNTTWQNLNQGRYIFSNAPVRKVKITASKQGVGSGSVEVTVEVSKTINAPDIILR